MIRITLAPLQERPEDIRWLTERLLAAMTLEQARRLAMSETFLRYIMARNWQAMSANCAPTWSRRW